MLKRFLMVGGIALAAIVLVFGLSFVYRTSSLLASIIRPPVPAELQAAGVVTGKTLFSKAPYYHDDSLGVITDIEQGDDGQIILIGRRGAVYLDSDSRPANLAHYSLCMSDVVLARLSNGAFLCRGSWSQEATLFDRVGHKVWSYNARSPGIDDSVAGQIGGAEVVAVGLNGGGGVVLLNSDGKQLWQQPDGNVWHVEIATPDGTVNSVVLHSNAKGQLTLRDASGNVLAHYKPETYVSHFSLTAWDNRTSRNNLITASKEFLYVLAMNGTTLAKLSAPGTAAVDQVKGTPVHFSDKAVTYAALVPKRRWKRSVLYFYGQQNQLIYQEVLDHECGSLFARPNKNGVEDLLLGCDDAVWKYAPS